MNLINLVGLDIINAVLIPAFIGGVMAIGIPRYLNFMQTINAAVAQVARINLLAYKRTEEDLADTIKDISVQVTGISIQLRSDHHFTASQTLKNLNKHYTKLLEEGVRTLAGGECEGHFNEWLIDLMTNYGARVYALTPSVEGLFRMRSFYDDTHITADKSLRDFKPYQLPKMRDIV